MIRFSCPGCNATYSVDDSKGGKTGKCPKCATQFQIPMPEVGASPPAPASFPAPPPPPPMSTPGDVSASSTVEIDPCPGCQARLSVNGSDIGIDVECPYCKTVYKATRAGTRPANSPPPPMKMADEEERPSRRRSRRDEDDEDDRPSRRSRRDEDDDDDDRPSRRRSRRDDDDDDDDDRPSRRRRRRRGGRGSDRGSYEPHRGVLILVLALLGLCCCIPPICAIVMGFQDLGKMNNGEMDPGGKGLTIAGIVIAFIMVGLNVLGGIMNAAGNGGGGP